MDNIAIGIDLGTTNSCAVYYSNRRVKVLENKEGGRITPSFVFFAGKNSVIVGEFAKLMAENKPEFGVYEIKRLVGRKFDDPAVQNNLQYFPFKVENESNDPVVIMERQNQTLKKTPMELCSIILAKIKNDVEAKLGHTVEKAVITVPAYFNISQREVTLAAANKAGFTVLKLLNEPTAAALSYYLENDCENESYSLVYDLGGGTFDVAILKKSSGNIDIICVDGDTHLGGQDLDNLIIDYVCDVARKQYNCDLKSERRTFRRLLNLCEGAKKVLSVAEETVITLHGFLDNHRTIEIPLSRTQFETMAHKHFARTIDIVNHCLKTSKLPKSAIEEVILSGGSTRIPKIQQMLSDYFGGKNLNKFVNPDECVAEGAALQAAMLSDNPRQEIREIRLIDVVPLSLGAANFIDLMTVTIQRNTPIPASESTTYTTAYDQQRSISFDIYEGERSNVKKNHYLGKMTITDLTPAPPGQCDVILTMKIDQNGILTVSAKEKYKDNYKDLKIDYARGHWSDKEVNNALKDAQEHEEEDERFRRFASKKEYLLKYCIRAVYNFAKLNLITSHQEAYDLCNNLKSKAEQLDVEDNEEIKKMTQEVKNKCESIVEKYNFEYMPYSLSD